MTPAGIFTLGAWLALAVSTQQPGQIAASDSTLDQARQLLQSGNLGGAEKAARLYVASHPNSSDGHYVLGRILFLEKKAAESLAEFTAGAKYRPPTVEDLKVVASDYVVLGDYTDADKWFTKVVEWAPDDAQGWYYLGRTKYNENRFEEAVSAFKRCLQLDPKNVKAEDNLGLSYAGLGRHDEAVAAYHTAIDWQKDATTKDFGPYLDLGTLLLETNKSEEAIPYLQVALQLNANDPKIHNQLGKAYLHANELVKAQAELERAVALAPNSAPEHFMLGQIYRKEGQEDKAKEELARFTQLNGAHSTDVNGVH
jgi:tetratricopeptide (TPR) repeat protein